MKLKKTSVLFLFAALAASSFCQDTAENRKPIKYTPVSIALSVPRPALPKDITPPSWFNEKLDFTIKWGILSVGNAVMQSDGLLDVEGILCYYLKTTAKSTSFVDTFFKVRDINESIIKVSDMYSLGFTKQIREGTYLWDEWVIFDDKNKRYNGQKKDKEGNISVVKGKISGKVQDILSSMYYVRTHKLEVGKKIVFDVNTKKNWPLIVKVLKREKVKVPAGKFDCFVLEPKMRDKGIFVQKGKSIKVWVTADKYHMPVLMKAEVFIGHVSAMLESYSRPAEKTEKEIQPQKAAEVKNEKETQPQKAAEVKTE